MHTRAQEKGAWSPQETESDLPMCDWELLVEAWLFSKSSFSLGSKITVDSEFSHQIKRLLLLGRKVMTNLNNVLKSRDIILPTKFCIFKAMVFPVIMLGCDTWTVKKKA